ncbi:MAG: hypothetical protein RBU30_14840 [Polyangia bacterium]|jgi:hypothetical protein|nr:hypothetical protein [Polyangia bacterium]
MTKLTPAERLQTLRAEEQVLTSAVERLASEQNGLTHQARRPCPDSGVEGRLHRVHHAARRWDAPLHREMGGTPDPMPALDLLTHVVGYGWSHARKRLLDEGTTLIEEAQDLEAAARVEMAEAQTSQAFEAARERAVKAHRRAVALEAQLLLVRAAADEERQRATDTEAWADLAQAEAERREQLAREAEERIEPASEKLTRVQSRLEQLRSELATAENQLVEAL